MFQPLDYTFEIVLAMCAIYIAFLAYIRYFKVDKNADGDKILLAYLELEKVRSVKNKR